VNDLDDRSWPDRAEVTDPAAIALLTDLRGLRMLTPFLVATHTLTSAARMAERPVTTLAHWVPRFVAAGLLERRGEIARAGASMPQYRAPARTLVVPYGLVPLDARVRLLDEGRMRLLRRFLDGLDESLEAAHATGLSFAAYGETGMVIDLDDDEAARQQRHYTDGWRTISLDEADALRLAREIEELVERYARRGGHREYVVHAGIAPDPQFRWRSATDPR
jgi:hypothetical protein